MKKIVSIALISLFSVNVNALDLTQAIDIALQKNFDIKSKEFDYKKTLKNEDISNSSFLPKINVAYTFKNTDEEVFNNNQENSRVFSGNISYNLFNGFKDISSKNSTKYLSEISKYYLDATIQDKILEVKIAYINYLDAKNSLETYESAYNLFKEQYEDSKNKFEQGLIARNDLLQVEVNMSSSKQNVVKASGDLKIAKYKLSNILGGYDLQNEQIKGFDDKSLDLKNYDENILENRSEIKALQKSLDVLNEEKKIVNSLYYPKIDASFSHEKYYDISPNSQNIALLSASWNLYNGGADSSKKDVVKIESMEIKNQLSKTKLDIKLQYESAKSDFQVARDNLETSKLSLTQAKENYQIVKNRFSEGVASTTDLTDANYLLTQAKQRYNKAYFDKYLSIATLDRIFEIN